MTIEYWLMGGCALLVLIGTYNLGYANGMMACAARFATLLNHEDSEAS